MRVPGEKLGRYVLVRRIGQGGMGEVWEAVMHGPEGFRKPVALKLLRARAGSEGARDALVREARLGALLSHPNVVTTFSLANLDGTWIVAMELVHGATAAELLRAHGPLPPSAVLEIGVQACAGLHHAHRLRVGGAVAGLVHRDVKPANVLVDRAGVVKVADLGISRLGSEAAVQLGTPGYMAPEQVAGEAEDHRVDVFSLGATLCALAVGRTPFGSGEAAMARTLAVEGLLARGVLRAVDEAVPGLASLVEQCLRRDPADRWDGTAELGFALSALKASAPPGPTLLELLRAARPELEIETAEATPIAVMATGARPTLPAPADRFVGREADVAALAELVRRGERLLTVLGMGGAGKTRLALEVGRTVGYELPGGAWLADLTDAHSVEGMCTVLARTFGLLLERAEPVEQVGYAVRARGRTLVILDNLEHLVELVPETVRRWVELAPAATWLCTSRVALRVKGERRVPLEPLRVADGVALFEERTRAPATPEVAALVEVVEGLPLAIELAAARSRLLPVPELLHRLRDGLEVLSGGPRDGPGRQRSLTASLDASWELLSEPERRALGAVTVFEGGFTLEAAEAVVPPGDAAALDLLEALVDASLVRVEDRGRFGLHAMVRAYASERLDPGERADAQVRHGAWYAQLGGEEALQGLDRHGGVARWHSLALETDNLVAACRRAVARRDGRVAARTALAASAVLQRRGPVAVAVALLEAAASVASGDDRLEVRLTMGHRLLDDDRIDDAAAVFRELRHEAVQVRGAWWAGRIVYAVGWAALVAGQLREARDALEEAWSRVRQAGDEECTSAVASALATLDRTEERRGPARQHARAALELARRRGDRRAEALLLASCGLVEPDADESERLHRRALALAREVGDRSYEAWATLGLGSALGSAGRADEALEAMDAAHALYRELGTRSGEAQVHLARAQLLRVLGRRTEARADLLRALSLWSELGYRRHQASALAEFGLVEMDDGNAREAHRRLGEARAIAEELGDREMEPRVLSSIGVLHARDGGAHEARRVFRQVASLHHAAQNRRGEAGALFNLGIAVTTVGGVDEGLEAMERALLLYREEGDRRGSAVVLANLASFRLALGEWPVGRRLLTEALDCARAVGYRRIEMFVLRQIAHLETALGEFAAARGHLDEADAIARATGDRSGACRGRGVLVAWFREQGRLSEARRACEEALALARELDERPYEGELLGELGVLEALEGDPGGARRLLEQAAAAHSEHHAVLSRACTLVELAKIDLSTSDLAAARSRLVEADPVLRRFRPDLAELLLVRAELEHAEGRTADAATTLAEATALVWSFGGTERAPLRAKLARTRVVVVGTP